MAGFGGWGLRLGLGKGRGGSRAPAAPIITSLSISPDGGPAGTTFAAVLSWTGWPRTGVAYEWRDGGVAIGGATGATYTPAEPIAALTVFVAIDNGEGTDSATSATVEVTEVPTGDALLLTEGGDAILLTEGGDPVLLSEAA